MQIDHYGFEYTSQYFQRRELEPYKIKKADETTTFVCFHDQDPRPIHKIVKDAATGDITVTWAYGAWDNAASLAYQPVNTTKEV